MSTTTILAACAVALYLGGFVPTAFLFWSGFARVGKRRQWPMLLLPIFWPILWPVVLVMFVAGRRRQR